MTATVAPTTKVACGAFSPISWSKKDTPQTVEQIKEHNAAGTAICPEWRKP